ncbi:hypothetical protein [Pandoraea sp. XY-2]|nr:hypothetical protein [Pandoraea sp. XY-2]
MNRVAVASVIKITVYPLLDHRAARQARHLERVERHLSPLPSKPH